MEMLNCLFQASECDARSASFTSGSAGVTAPWSPVSHGVLVTVDAPAYVLVNQVSDGTTATASLGVYIPAGQAIPFTAPIMSNPNNIGQWRVSALGVTGSGTVYARPINIR